ncbi:hypothetical protein FISHEDRAFT_57181 [Fistulina hepatica ATCC 64428]|nr:hypothetical protein FISHEDRAFT_57181 [Fistulina hepatica ATCC 64428]
MATSTIDLSAISSPTFSAVSSVSSFDVISSCSRSSTTSTVSHLNDSDDEVVWGVVSEDSSLSTESSPRSSDDDFVVLAQPRSLVAGRNHDAGGDAGSSASEKEIDQLVDQLSSVALDKSQQHCQSSVGREVRHVASGGSVSSNAPRQMRKSLKKRSRKPRSTTSSPTKADNIAERGDKAKSDSLVHKAIGLGQRSIVEDISEMGDTQSVMSDSSDYDEAVQYVTKFISNPSKDRRSHLTFLQSLIIELGLTTTTNALPESLKACRTIIKSNAFLNIKEYLAIREQGLDAVRQAMYPSRSSLMKDIRKKGHAAPLAVVKQSGLNVLLVTLYCH